VMAATTLVNVETILFDAGSNYNITTNDTTIPGGRNYSFDANALGATNSLTLDLSAETNGRASVAGGAGADDITLGAGHDTVHAGDGDDTVHVGKNFDSGDLIDGGLGTDTLTLKGDYTSALADTDLVNVERMVLGAGHNYILSTDDGVVGAGQTFTV